MRAPWRQMPWLSILLLTLASCRSTTPDLKPPKQPEDYSLPAPTDRRYTAPIAYPRETLEHDLLKKKAGESAIEAPYGPRNPAMGGVR